MKNTLPMLVIAIVALGLGGAVGWYMADSSSHGSTALESNQTGRAALDNATPLEDETEGEPAKRTDESKSRGDSKLLKEAREELADLKKERDELAQANKELSEEASTREARITELETQLEASKQPEVSDKRLPVNFGKWDSVDGLRDANWKEIGDVYSKMGAIVKERVKAVRDGREPDPEGQKQLGELNKMLQNHLVSFFNKLPTNSGPNEQFTHPANLVNTLAGQLEAADLPLTENQIEQLGKLGDEYDKKWDALQRGYTDSTWTLEKILDESELKEWFHDEMFKVCTVQQKEAALPAEIDGIVGADFYSAGLFLNANMGMVNPVNVADTTEAKTRLREWVTARSGLSSETIDAADFLFDDWLNTLSDQLTPKSEIEANLTQCRDVIRAGRAQLTALKALSESYATTPEAKRGIAAIVPIALPQVVLPE